MIFMLEAFRHRSKSPFFGCHELDRSLASQNARFLISEAFCQEDYNFTAGAHNTETQQTDPTPRGHYEVL